MRHEHQARFHGFLGVLAAAIGVAAWASSASAQDAPPSFAQRPPPPPPPSYASDEEGIRGRIASINGAYALSVRDNRGFLDSVALHKGTIINPTGLRLAPGMRVVILGRNSGSVFVANEIDTPYAYAHRGPYGHTTVILAPRFGW